jgi:SAM-dependent methyltransferase
MRAVDELLRATARVEARHFWFRGFRWFVVPLVRRALDGRAPGRILDCGCGTGANLQMLAEFGTPYGFDLTEAGLYIGRQAGRRRLARASVAAAPFRSDSFDLVTSFDVLYSLPEPDEQAAIREMFRVTRPGGCVVINVAAMESLRGNHSIAGREVRRYTRATLAALVVGAGFTIERLTYTNAVLFGPLLALRTFERWRGLASEAEAVAQFAVPPKPVNGALTAAVFVESIWLRRLNMPFGSSLICIARKPEPKEPGRAPRT